MLAVRDIMQRSVMTVAPDTSVRQLSRLLADEEISGAPVVDANGSVVGVVSATDVVRLAADDADVHVTASTLRPDPVDIPDPNEDEVVDPDPYGFFLPEDCPLTPDGILEQFAESGLDSLAVSDIMTPVTFSVGPEMSVRELAEFLVRGRIHRAVVLDAGRLQGIVTSGDILRTVADGLLEA
jgi:CBS domain-containing protein